MPTSSSLEAINKLYDEYKENYNYLINNGQVSFALDYKAQYAKVMLLSAASYFEIKIMIIVKKFLNYENCPIRAGFLEKKALKRQYHTLFNWDQPNATQFFSLFGSDFKIYVSTVISNDEDLRKSIEDFMILGSYRNKLVHDNYATFNLPLTTEDIKTKFDNADIFVSRIENFVTGFKQSL